MSCRDLFGVVEDGTLYRLSPPESSSDQWIKTTLKDHWPPFQYQKMFFNADGGLYGVSKNHIRFTKELLSPQAPLTTNSLQQTVFNWPILSDFKFLFFDLQGSMLYGVKDDKLYKGTFPTGENKATYDATLLGASGWYDFKFLFFDQVGILHGVKNNGRFYKRSPPSGPGDNWLETAILIGSEGWSDFQFLLFISTGELFGVYQDKLYQGSAPTQSIVAKTWRDNSTLTGQSGWSQYHFLMSPLRHE